MTIETIPQFWDCECKEDYIRSRNVASCERCNAVREEQPDSRLLEIETSVQEASRWAKELLDAIAIETFYGFNMQSVLISMKMEGKASEIVALDSLIRRCKDRRGMLEQNPAA